MQAVILAAGLGSRIREYHHLPKGFIRVGDEPIIVDSINILKRHGIEKILIVTGYRSNHYDNLAKKIPGITTKFNTHYSDRGSLYSLYCAKHWVSDDFLLLESDLLYDARAIEMMCNAEQQTTVLLSGMTGSGDEVYVEANGQQLIKMSKQFDTLNPEQIYGEFVGINKLCFSDYQQLVSLLESDSTLLNSGCYEEHGLVALTKQHPIYCLKVPDLLWCEIDDWSHLQRAKKMYKAINSECRVMQRNILLNPGPVTTTYTVKKALVVPDICHREREFTELLKSIRDDLLKVVNAQDDYTSVLFTASGTAAIEAGISSVIAKDKTLAVINNGSYGQRMVDIAKRYGIDVVEIKFAYDQPIDLKRVESKLIGHPDVQYLAMVHHETSSGILNPLHDVGQLCHRLGCGFIVDAMSSFAGTEIDVNADRIDFIISSSNKCLHGMPGLSFVICNKTHLIAAKDNARSYYLDLYQQYHALENTGQMPFTPAVQVAYSLRQALDEFFVETLKGRIKRYQDNYACLVAGLRSLGFGIVTPEPRQSQLLVTVRFPEDGADYQFDALHDYLYEKGYTIYPKKLAIDNTFRLACIGHLDKTDIQHFLAALKAYSQSVTRKQGDLV